MEEAQFMGVVKAIAHEVEREQSLGRGELLGASYIQCKRLLPKYDPKQCSTFARYAYLHVKTSLTRDVTRDRRAVWGLRHDGTERPERQPPPDFHDFQTPHEELPPWWPMLSKRQQSIVLLTSQNVRKSKIAKWLEIETADVEAEIAAVQHTLISNRVPGLLSAFGEAELLEED